MANSSSEISKDKVTEHFNHDYQPISLTPTFESSAQSGNAAGSVEINADDNINSQKESRLEMPPPRLEDICQQASKPHTKYVDI